MFSIRISHTSSPPTFSQQAVFHKTTDSILYEKQLTNLLFSSSKCRIFDEALQPFHSSDQIRLL